MIISCAAPLRFEVWKMRMGPAAAWASRSSTSAPKMAAKAKGKVLAKELPPAHDDDDDDDDEDGEPPTVTRGGRVSRPRGR